MHQFFTSAFAHEGLAAFVSLGISLQSLVVATQFSAGLTPYTLIQQLQHHEIGLLVLTLVERVKIIAAEILQIGHHQPEQSTGFKNAPALLKEWCHQIARDVLQEVGGVD